MMQKSVIFCEWKVGGRLILWDLIKVWWLEGFRERREIEGSSDVAGWKMNI
jgi:hypothetical protein